MAEEKRRYKAVINGKTYVIIGPGSEAHMAAVTEMLNQQLQDIQKLSSNISTEDAAILLAFNAISDQIKYKEEIDDDSENHE
ncbi:cell division protein ZapA [Agrilactobacillus fermenti]|uniref:cell division protein ZapA n=1 Tax=Agrilactobacillus fermenti TaxID=2586909 RepID=UPI001E3F3B48|nr:cell division protein ZapA [Agrilactobacillus fermenti]MCD2256777.1 cell division protein ZapA [Agrilactobacillus fermenti]